MRFAAVDRDRLIKQVALLLINDVPALCRKRGVSFAEFARRVPPHRLWELAMLMQGVQCR